MLHFYTLAIVTTVDHCCRTAFKFIWFAHTLNYILCGNVKWFFVCFALHCIKYRIVLHCIVFCGSVRCGAARHNAVQNRAECYIIFRAGIVFLLALGYVIDAESIFAVPLTQ